MITLHSCLVNSAVALMTAVATLIFCKLQQSTNIEIPAIDQQM